MVSSHILDKKRSHSRAGAIIQECKILLSRLPSIRCLTIRREANSGAHNLTRHSLSMLPLRTARRNCTVDINLQAGMLGREPDRKTG
ncbi:hypothetical protein LINPERHAP1_LOCUS12426 [Linum perenne]